MGMKKTLMCATAAVALVSISAVANAEEEGWYTRADIGWTPFAVLDHDPAVANVVGSIADNSNVTDLLGGWLGAGYDFGNNFRLESTFGYRGGDLGDITDSNGIPATGLAVSGCMLRHPTNRCVQQSRRSQWNNPNVH